MVVVRVGIKVALVEFEQSLEFNVRIQPIIVVELALECFTNCNNFCIFSLKIDKTLLEDVVVVAGVVVVATVELKPFSKQFG